MPATQPPLAISTCWNSERHSDGRELMEELIGLGFSHVELGHGIRYSLWPGILDCVESGRISVNSLHNFCPLPLGFMHAAPNCYQFSDSHPRLRQLALRHSLETVENAAKLGAKVVVLHLGNSGQRQVNRKLERLFAKGSFGGKSYAKKKIRSVLDHEKAWETVWPRVEAILSPLAERANQLGVQLGFECREAVEEIPLDSFWEEILDRFKGVAGYWHDFGHAARKDCLGFIDQLDQFGRLAARLVGCHIHDFLPPARDHLPPGDGIIPFNDFWPLLKTEAIFILELAPKIPMEKVGASLQWWNNNGPRKK